jgi:hypothetical protein
MTKLNGVWIIVREYGTRNPQKMMAYTGHLIAVKMRFYL